MKFVITGKFPSLNEYTEGNRNNRYHGAKIKKDCQQNVIQAIRQAKLPKVSNYPIHMKITWYEANRRRDIDNITYAVKFINDGLVQMGVIADDSQRFIRSIENVVEVDKENPRIEVEIKEGKT